MVCLIIYGLVISKVITFLYVYLDVIIEVEKIVPHSLFLQFDVLIIIAYVVYVILCGLIFASSNFLVTLAGFWLSVFNAALALMFFILIYKGAITITLPYPLSDYAKDISLLSVLMFSLNGLNAYLNVFKNDNSGRCQLN